MCGASTVFIKVFVFVGIDHLAKQEIVDVEKDEAGPSSSSRTSGLPTKPKGLFPTTKKIKSFAEYKKGKEIINSTIDIYADDTTLLSCSKWNDITTLNQTIAQDLNNIEKWAIENKMFLNAK